MKNPAPELLREGDQIEVVRPGGCYSSYREWHGWGGRPPSGWGWERSLDLHTRGVIHKLARHGESSGSILAWIKTTDGRDFLINTDAVIPLPERVWTIRTRVRV